GMVLLLSLLLVFWSGIQADDSLFGKSYLIFESEGARSLITLQRGSHGNQGLKYLNASIEHNIDDVPYQSILGSTELKLNFNYTFDLHQRTEQLNFIVNFIDPCCKDKWVASIEYSEEKDTLLISYENCTQTEISFESLHDPNLCYSSSLQLGSHCSLFCTCSSLPSDGKCPSPDSSPMIKCDQFDNSFDTCNYNSQSETHEMPFYWFMGQSTTKGSITSRVIENERVVAFDLIIDNANTQDMDYFLYFVFGSKIDISKEFRVPFDRSFVMTIKTGSITFALRFDISSLGEVSVFYRNCEQFRMSDSGVCYEGSDFGMFYFCEDNGNIFSSNPYIECDDPLPLTMNSELKLFSSVDSSLEVGTFNTDQSSDSPGMLHAVYIREQMSSNVDVYVDGYIVYSNQLEKNGEREANEVVTIDMKDRMDDWIEGHVQVIFTHDGRILTVVDGCTQFEIFSNQDILQCRSQSVDQGIFCFCNRDDAILSDCQPLMNPIIIDCNTTDPEVKTTITPVVSTSFDVLIDDKGKSQTATYELSWEWDKNMGTYLFKKGRESVNIVGADEFHTLDVLNGIINEDSFTLALGDTVIVSLPMSNGELFVMNFVPQYEGIELIYRQCSLGMIFISSPTDLPCIIDSNGGWNFSICPGGISGNPQQFQPCSPPIQPQIYQFDLISDLNSLYLYVGTARMDLQIFWNEERPDFFDLKVKQYTQFGGAQLLINHVEYYDGQSVVFSIGTTIPIDFNIHEKRLFEIEVNLNSPIVSVIANDCEQFKLTENICRGEHTIFYNFKFCASSEHFSQNLLTCSGKTDPPIIIPSVTPYETHKMHFTYSNYSRRLDGFVTEEIKQDDGEVLERSLLFDWSMDDDVAPFPFSLSFTTMNKTIKETTPSYLYSIPFEVDTPVIFIVLDSLNSILFQFSILIEKKSASVLYGDCVQFSIDEPDGRCYGTPEGNICSGDNGDGKELNPFITCIPTSSPSQSDLRAYFIYQADHKIFIWDLILSKDDKTGEWIVEASETGSTTMEGGVTRGTGSTTMEGGVTRGNTAASTLTFSVSVGELTVFSVRERETGSLIDSFSILPSSHSIAVLYNDCTQFSMGKGGDTVECYQQMKTRICNGEPTKESNEYPMRPCNVLRFSLRTSHDYGIVSQQTTDKYQQVITVVPPKSLIHQLTIYVVDEPFDSFFLTPDYLQLITISLDPYHSFYLLPINFTTSVLSESHCRQFEMEGVDDLTVCYSDGDLLLCPQHDTQVIMASTLCLYKRIYFSNYSPPDMGQLGITHFTPSSIPPITYSILTGYWQYSESEFVAKVGDTKMDSNSYHALSPDGSAHFSFPYIPMSFSIELENGMKSAVKHEGCFQFYMEDDDQECYQDNHSQLCEEAAASRVNNYRECFSTVLPPITISTEGTHPIDRTTEGRTMTEGESSTAFSTIDERVDTTESMVKTTIPTIPTTGKTMSTPSSTVYASIILKEVSIRIEKKVDNSISTGKIVFDVKAIFISKPDYKIYVDTIEYPFNNPCQEVHHNVGETLNITIASGTETLMRVELEIHTTTCTVLELDDCPQFTLEENAYECRSSDLICVCANSDFACPINGDPLETCSTTSLPPSPFSTTEGALDTTMFPNVETTTLTPFDTTISTTLETMFTAIDSTTGDPTMMTTVEWTTEFSKSSTTSDSFPSDIDSSTPSIESSTGTNVDSTTDSPSTSSLPTPPPKKSLDNLANLANQTITIDNVSQVLEETNAIVNMGSQKMEGQHIYYVSEILYNSANVTGISQSDAELVLDTLDDCLGAPEKSFKDSAENHDQAPQKFLQTLPLLVVNSPSEKLFLNGQLLGFSSQKHACIDEKDTSVFGLADTKDGFIAYSDEKSNENLKSSIEIPIDAVCGNLGTHSLFSIHRTTKLFLGGINYRRLAVKSSWFGSNDQDYKQSSQSRALISSLSIAVEEDVDEEEILPEACSSQQSLLDDQPVLTATVIDNSDGEMKIVSKDEEKGTKMATVVIDLTDLLRPLHGSLSFSWWDGSSLQWSTSDHCQLREGQWGGKVVADCFHLTDFTLIVDGTVNDPCVCDTALIIVGYIISAVSICSLFIVVFATIINRIPSFSRMKVFSIIRDDLFRHRFHSVDILYTISLLFFYLIFTLFHDQSVAGHACVLFAVISYSLLFCTVLLTLFQSYRTIATFSPYPIIRRVLSFASHQIFVCTVSAGAPFLISSILAIVSNFFDRDDGFCWVRPDYITFAVVLPLSVLILNGVICTILVVIRLYQEQKSQLMTGKNHLKRRIISVLIMQFTLGMPWVLQYLTLYAPTSTLFHYLFTIVNGSQGIVLLLLYLYRRERRMTSMRRRRGAAMAARGVHARQMGAKHRSDDEGDYDYEMDGKSTEGIVH
ncbi:hypothetical protein PENTCL1PPCAC_18200, partial [Pristionchus entomophagus]